VSRWLRLGVGRIGSTPISVLVLIALFLIVVRFAIRVLEATTPEVKRRSSSKEVGMDERLIAISLLDTAWAIGVSAVAGYLSPLT
jgi:hypothetical protein